MRPQARSMPSIGLRNPIEAIAASAVRKACLGESGTRTGTVVASMVFTSAAILPRPPVDRMKAR
jgi:hypothetical protein